MTIPLLGPGGHVETEAEFLALALSAPSAGVLRNTAVTARIDPQHASVTVQSDPMDRGSQILCSKECIEWCFGLYTFWRDAEGWADEDALTERVITAVSEVVVDAVRGERRRFEAAELARRMDMTPTLFETAQASADETLRRLEERGLVYDPVAIPGLLVFAAGLLPVHWSVRTIQGEVVYREIEVRAKLWRYRRRGPPSSRAWDFDFRGVEWVMRLLNLAARGAIDAEAGALLEEGRPVQPRVQNPTLSRDDRTI